MVAVVTAAAVALSGVVIGFLMIWGRAERARDRAERALAASDERLGFALENTRLGLWDWCVPSGAVYYSSRSMAMLGYEPGSWDPTFESFVALIHAEDVEAVLERLRSHTEGGEPAYRAEFRMRRGDGSWAWVLAHGRIVESGPDGRAVRMIGTIQDITERHEREQALEEAAILDPLLGIRNRRGYERHAPAVVARAVRDGEPVSLVMIDLDHFKVVNDHYGHDVGDEALRTLCRALEVELRHEDRDMLFRLGGEEFVVVLSDTDIVNANHVAERLRSRVEQTPVLFEERCFSITASFGVASWRPGEDGLEGALRRADAALYDAKASGRNRVSVHASPMPPRLTIVKA
jgi:diguanylate cyclase (GGDEF)-like protein/PAS domain S-box-containing protein